MKKLLFTTLIFLSLAFAGFSQTIPPPYINYQAVLYDVNSPNPNTPLTNQSFTTFVNINDELGDLLYREEHYASTDANGLITVKIGDGAYVAGSISNLNDINWGVGKYFLVVDFVINGDTSSTASEQLVTVPYSFYAGKAGNGISAIADNGDGTLTFVYLDGTTYTTPILSGLQGPIGPAGPAGSSGGYPIHTIGESYGGGIVFYVYDGGQHGLIAATADQSTGIQWDNGIFRSTGATGDGLGAGAMNTAIIVATQMADNQTGNFAAKVCADYSVTGSNGIDYFGDWYLPSWHELSLLNLQKNVVGGFADNHYWSSTEMDAMGAFYNYLGNGIPTLIFISKGGSFNVRAIRAF